MEPAPETPATPPQSLSTASIHKTVEDLKKYANTEALNRLDWSTLQAVCATVALHGLGHFEQTKNTQLKNEARSAHHFVARNCEDLSRRILLMSGRPAKECEFVLHEIMRQTLEFKRKGKPT